MDMSEFTPCLPESYCINKYLFTLFCLELCYKITRPLVHFNRLANYFAVVMHLKHFYCKAGGSHSSDCRYQSS